MVALLSSLIASISFGSRRTTGPCHLVAFGDVRVLDDPDARYDLLVVHPPAGGFLDLPEGNFRLRLDGVVYVDAEAQSQEVLPVRARAGHGHNT